MTETGWIIGMLVTFTAGFLVGMAFKNTTHREEIRNIVNLTDQLREREIARKREKVSGMKIPVRKEGPPKGPPVPAA